MKNKAANFFAQAPDDDMRSWIVIGALSFGATLAVYGTLAWLSVRYVL